MPFTSSKSPLILDPETRSTLEALTRSRNAARGRVDRAVILLSYADGRSISTISRERSMSRSAVNRIVNRALEVGAVTALEDRPRSGRPTRLTKQARAWLVSLACQKPKDLGYPHELWTVDLLAGHARNNCSEAGHPSLSEIAGGTVSKILKRNKIRPHKVRYLPLFPGSSATRSGRTRFATTWKDVIPTSTRRWSSFCSSMKRSRCSVKLTRTMTRS